MEVDREGVIRALFDGWEQDWTTLMERFETYVAPDMRWEQSGFPTTTTKADAVALLSGLNTVFGVERIVVEMGATAVDGETVLNERVDTLLRADGSVAARVPMMAAFEVGEDGLIHAWREYFDPGHAPEGATGGGAEA